MSGPRRLLLPALAAVFVIAGFGLMVASLGVGSNDAQSEFASDVTVPTDAVAWATPVASDPRATQLVARAQEADRTRSYGGVKLVSRWTNGKATSVVVAVDHVPGAGTAVAPGDSGAALQDASALVLTAEGVQRADDAMLGALVQNYRLTRAPTVETSIGRMANTVEATRSDGTLAARFWLDTSTGLVLRRDVMDKQGKKIESASFLRITFHTSSSKAGADDGDVPTDWTSVDDHGAEVLRAAGWPIPRELPAGWDLYQVLEQGTGGGQVLQLSYTDGLTAMSVFLQHGSLDEDALAGYESVETDSGEVWVRSSGTRFLTWQAHAVPVATETFIASTVASEAPSATSSAAPADVRDIVVSVTTDSPSVPTGSAIAAFPPTTAADDGVADRVTRGVQRVGSWIDPLD